MNTADNLNEALRPKADNDTKQVLVSQIEHRDEKIIEQQK